MLWSLAGRSEYPTAAIFGHLVFKVTKYEIHLYDTYDYTGEKSEGKNVWSETEREWEREGEENEKLAFKTDCLARG